MAIKITGLFTNPISEQIFKDPVLVLIPHLEPYGKINMDVNITNLNGDVKGCIPYFDISNLNYGTLDVDPYSHLIKTLQDYVINNLLGIYPDLIYEII
jgi:hypothetical protein